MADENIPMEPQSRKNDKVSRTILLLLLTILVALLAFYPDPQEERQEAEQREAEITTQLFRAEELVNMRKFSDAIPILNKVIAADPNRFRAYQLRSIAYGNSRSNNYEEQQSYYVKSLHDIDKMIQLDPANGNHYVARDLLFRSLAEMAPDSASEFALYELANDNAEKAMELGVTPDYAYVYRHHARNLIESNHCEEGLQETQEILAHTRPDDPNLKHYNTYLTEAYLCLGDLDKALEAAEKIDCEDLAKSCRSMYLVEIYFQSGESEKALETLNYLIDAQPAYGAWRYFIRALIYYENGLHDLALQDLEMGDNYSWYSNGVYWYVKAEMAFDEGDDENGMLYLQNAESTLNIQYMPLRKKVQAELTERGGSPLVVPPKIPLATTPIP